VCVVHGVSVSIVLVGSRDCCHIYFLPFLLAPESERATRKVCGGSNNGEFERDARDGGGAKVPPLTASSSQLHLSPVHAFYVEPPAEGNEGGAARGGKGRARRGGERRERK